jgi:hypothetical protein
MGLSPSPQVSVYAFELRVRPNTVKRVRPRQKTRPNIVRDLLRKPTKTSVSLFSVFMCTTLQLSIISM